MSGNYICPRCKTNLVTPYNFAVHIRTQACHRQLTQNKTTIRTTVQQLPRNHNNNIVPKNTTTPRSTGGGGCGCKKRV